VIAPSPFVLAAMQIAPPGPALDVACGGGRHALAIASTGRLVDAIDRDPERCAALARAARASGLPVRVVCADLTALPLPVRRWALVVKTLYLDRHLVPHLGAALVPGGVLVLETFTTAQLASGHPRNPAFTLHPGELPTLAGGFEVLDYREGAVERDGRAVHLASLVARAPAAHT
jgi:tellurite methyltransferase